MKRKTLGFLLVLIIWAFFTLLSYHRVIVFDNTTLAGAMLSGLVLSASVLSIFRLLKRIYDGTYSVLIRDDD